MRKEQITDNSKDHKLEIRSTTASSAAVWKQTERNHI